MASGNARDEIFTFYRDHFVTKWPKDTTTTHISRTIGENQLVDELVMHFTHDALIDALFPGVAPTGKPVALPVVVMKFHDGKVAHEHIYWDQASLLVQVGLLDRSNLPITVRRPRYGVSAKTVPTGHAYEQPLPEPPRVVVP
jgi:carboxymethylenebutenolidase